MGEVINGVASEYEMPRKTKCYKNNVGLSMTGCNISMPNVRQPIGSGDKICSTCNKEDVCMYKAELEQVAKEITRISEKTDVFVDVDIRCKKWSGKVVNMRGLE